MDSVCQCVHWDVDFFDPHHALRIADAPSRFPLFCIGAVRQRRELHWLLTHASPIWGARKARSRSLQIMLSLG